MNETRLLPDIKLRFNIEHPTLEEAYIFGYECARADLAESDNPFTSGTFESEHWIDGWWAGFYGEKPAFVFSDEYEVSYQVTPANDHVYHDNHDHFFIRLLEISGVLVVSAIVGYQLIELVA